MLTALLCVDGSRAPFWLLKGCGRRSSLCVSQDDVMGRVRRVGVLDVVGGAFALLCDRKGLNTATWILKSRVEKRVDCPFRPLHHRRLSVIRRVHVGLLVAERLRAWGVRPVPKTANGACHSL